MEWHTKLLEELVYERVRLHVDLLELVDFERDLDESIGRAMRECGIEDARAPEVARTYVALAWRRIEQEWTSGRASDWRDCPLCEAPFECPRPRGDAQLQSRSG